MRQIKLLILFVATMFATNMWAEPADLGSGTGLQWEIVGTTLTITYSGDGSGIIPDYKNRNNQRAPWYEAPAGATITAISLPNDGLVRIGNYAFNGCANASLTTVTIPSSVTAIGDNAFAACWYLTTINMLPTSAPTIGDKIFNGNEQIDHINVPDASAQAYANALWQYWDYVYEATSGNHAPAFHFEGDFGAETNNLHWDVTGSVLTITGTGSTGGFGIGGGAQPWLAYKSVLTRVNLPAGITYIGSDDFFGLEVVEVHISANPDNLTWEEGGDDFKGDKATTCYVPSAYLSAYEDKFPDVNVTFAAESSGGGGEEPVADPNGLGWNYNAGVLTITYDGEGTGIMDDYSISDKAPWYADHHWDITSIVLPEGLTHIGSYAFHSLSGVTSITLPSTLTSIGGYAFSGCYITSVTIPSSMTAVSDNAFNMCSKLESVTIPSTVTRIGANAFSGTKIASVTIPNAVTVIDEGAFGYNSALSSITIPANVTEIGLSAFSYCTALTSVTCLPTTAPTLGNNAFYNHHEDLVITYPNGSDQDYANKFLQYYDCLRNASSSAQAPLPHLTGTSGSLTWDLSFTGSGTLMEHDGTLAITGTGAMADYNWPNNEWAPWFYVGDFINHINIASGVTKIGTSAFAKMRHVNTFIIPASVTYIGGDAFFWCDNEEAIVYCYANPANLEWHDNIDGYEAPEFIPDDFLSLTRSPWGSYTWHVQATKCVVPSNYLEAYKAKWARGGENRHTDINVWFTSELQDGESAEYITNALNDLDGKTAPVVTLVRPLNRDGYFATLCLPFNMSAEQIAESSLHGAEIKEFTNATVSGGTLNIEFSPVSAIEAGKPYFVKYEDAELLGDALDRLDFMDVVINKTAPVAVTHGGLTMTGTYVPKSVSAQASATDGDGVLFLGPSNTLYWPSAAGNIKPFRAYFSIAGGLGAPIRRGMPARIVERENTATGVGEFESQKSNGEIQKVIENGQLIIIRNGEKFNAQGQIVK